MGGQKIIMPTQTGIKPCTLLAHTPTTEWVETTDDDSAIGHQHAFNLAQTTVWITAEL